MTQPRGIQISLDYVRSFVQAAERVLGEMIGEVPTKGTPILQSSSSIALQEINVVIAITGEVQGQVNYGMNLPTALAIASALIMEPVESLDELAIAALSEMGNMISGNARSFFHDLGIHTDISPPFMLQGKELVATWHKSRAMMIPLNLSHGKIFVTVGIRQEGPS